MNDAGSIIEGAWAYLTTAQNWTGARGLTRATFDGGWTFANDSILALGLEHIIMSVLAVAIAAALGLPLGALLGSLRKGGGAATALTNIARAVPTLALLTIFATSAIGFGNRAVVIAAAIFAFAPVVATTYAGISGVDPDVTDAARGQGMSRARIVLDVQLPLASPLIVSGLRTAVAQTVATVPLAALVAGGGLGVIVTTGLATQRYGQVLAGAILVAGLTLAADAVSSRALRLAIPKALRARSRPAYVGSVGHDGE